MDEAFLKEVRPLLDLVDQLRDVGINKEISLPQIAVMGDQSSGKSSVLQSISGIPFPRGSGLVTRCPLELIMKKSEPSSQWSAEVKIRWDKEQPIASGTTTSSFELSQKIEVLSGILAEQGTNGFSYHSIVVKVTAPDAPDLTLIDLPGIVRTATSGQNQGVIAQVNDLIQKYIDLPNTIILAVVPCNQDIATIDILERAAIADPAGVRTIGVLTKPDLIGPGNEDEVIEVLLNQRKPLRLGYTMLKNSNQKQLNEKISIIEARKDELNFFKNHEVFTKYVDKNLFGVENLTVSLTKLLIEHIKNTLPTILTDLRNLHRQAKKELSDLGEEPTDERKELQSKLIKKVSMFCQTLRYSSRGDYRDKHGILATSSDLRLYIQMSSFFKIMQDSILQQRPTFDNPEDELFVAIAEEMKHQRGRDLPGFINTQVFTTCVVKLVEDWRLSIDECVGKMINATLTVSEKIAAATISEYPELKLAMEKISGSLMEGLAEELRGKLEAIFSREQDPFTAQEVLLEVVNSIRFRTFDTILRQILNATNVKELQDNKYLIEEDVKTRLGNWYMQRHGVDSEGNLQEMTTLIQAYWDIASRRFIDNICMCIEKDFVGEFVTEVETQTTLYAMSTDETEARRLMQEDQIILEKRKRLRDKLKSYQRSLDILYEALLLPKEQL